MIKRLAFMAALLAPCLVYGGNPSADLSVQVVSAGSSACTNPTPPHPAQVAGFTTLAYCADFTTNTGTNNVVNHTSGTMAWTVLSNWLDCAGASASVAQWSLNNYIGHGNNCADISVANDPTAGSNVLVMNVTPSDTSIPFTLGIATAQNGNYLMTYPGTNNYAEVKYRIDPAQSSRFSGANVFFAFWSEYQTPCGLEIDFIETFGGSTNSLGQLVDWCNLGNHASDGNIAGPPFDSNYHVSGSLITSNGSSGLIGQCPYVDGVAAHQSSGGAVICNTITPSNGGFSYKQPSVLILWNNAAQAAPVAGGNVTVWVEWVRVWSCAGWQTGTPNAPNNTCVTASPFTGTPP
jgi:hypothetical protein